MLPRWATLKVIQSGFATDQLLVVQMLREACILEAITHPGVPIVYDAGRLHDGRPWFAFEAHVGPTLDAVLAAGRLTVIEVAALVRDLADILEHVHHRGVVHRGLRPDRVVITDARRYPLYVPDWSEAMVHDAAPEVSHVMRECWRSYVAPELLRSSAAGHGAVDARADVFALGVIAHRALTGGLPIAPGLGAAPYPPTHERRTDAPRALTEMIDSMLAFEPRDRPSAAEVRAGVELVVAAVSQLQGPSEPRREAPPIADAVGTPEELVALAQRQRFRRPRWTPEVRYVEATEDEGAAAELADSDDVVGDTTW